MSHHEQNLNPWKYNNLKSLQFSACASPIIQSMASPNRKCNIFTQLCLKADTHYPYVWPICTGRKDGCQKMHPDLRPVCMGLTYGCIFRHVRAGVQNAPVCTGRKDGPYVRAVCTGSVYQLQLLFRLEKTQSSLTQYLLLAQTLCHLHYLVRHAKSCHNVPQTFLVHTVWYFFEVQRIYYKWVMVFQCIS